MRSHRDSSSALAATYHLVPDTESGSEFRAKPTFRTSIPWHSVFSFLVGALISILCFSLVPDRSSCESRSETNGPVPTIPFTHTVFEKNDTYIARPGPASDHAWDHLLPPGRGFVFLNGSAYNLPPGQPTKWGEIYSISVFHQLHCLGQLRAGYWTLRDSVMTGDLRRAKKMLEGPRGGGEHVGHCFDYLRQSLMCAGDMSVEWPRVESDGRKIAVDGWGVEHRCRRWDAIMEYMDTAHFNNSWYSGIAD